VSLISEKRNRVLTIFIFSMVDFIQRREKVTAMQRTNMKIRVALTMSRSLEKGQNGYGEEDIFLRSNSL